MSSRRDFILGAFASCLSAKLATAQEQDEPQKLPNTPSPAEFLAEQKKAWEDSRRDLFQRYELCTKLERVFLTRYIAPFDQWMLVSGYLTMPEFSKNFVDDPLYDGRDIWFLLKIRCTDQFKGNDIWLKFSLTKEDVQLELQDDPNDAEAPEGERAQIMAPESPVKTLWRKRDGLFEALEHHLVQLLGDKENEATIIDGEAHLYRIWGPDADPSKVTKEQLLK